MKHYVLKHIFSVYILLSFSNIIKHSLSIGSTQIVIIIMCHNRSSDNAQSLTSNVSPKQPAEGTVRTP